MDIMTPRTPAFRMHALLALAVLALGLGSQAWGYHGCANHAESADVHAPDASAHAHAQLPTHSEDAGHGPCTCLGTCHGSAAATTLPPMAPVAPVAVVLRQPRVQATDTRAPVVRPAFLIPYSTAPPLSV